MSEYQYYEWQTVDRLLTESEQEAVGRLSSHIDVSSSRAVVTYEYGDFKHKPKDVLARYFDAHLYMANWGNRCLMFRFPKGLVDEKAVEVYCIDDLIEFETKDTCQILTIDLCEEDGFGWVECEGLLSAFVPLRAAVLEGDYRVLYLAWLKAIAMTVDSEGGEETRQLEPSVPAGLANPSPALKRFTKVFDIDPFLLEAAAETSPELQSAAEPDLRPLIARLSRQDCDDFLCRIAAGDATARLELKKRLQSFVDARPVKTAPRRTVKQLLADAHNARRKEDRRRKEEARKKHIVEMESLADRESETWQHIETLIQMKQPKYYDAAVAQLAKLRELAEFRKSKDTFRVKLAGLCEHYRNRPGLLHRIRNGHLPDDSRESASHADDL